MGGTGSGGYRKPSKPAPTSGPAQYSRRTDGQVQAPKQMDAQYYGDAKDMQQIQQGAAMAADPTRNAPAPGPVSMPQITGFGAPSQRPDEPVTAGAAMGAGPGPEALQLPQDSPQQAARQVAQFLPVMVRVAEGPYGSPELKQYIRAVIASL